MPHSRIHRAPVTVSGASDERSEWKVLRTSLHARASAIATSSSRKCGSATLGSFALGAFDVAGSVAAVADAAVADAGGFAAPDLWAGASCSWQPAMSASGIISQRVRVMQTSHA